MRTILLISPYWREQHRWMVSSVKLSELWQRMGWRVVVVCMGPKTGREVVSPTLVIHRVRDLFLPDPLNYGIAPTFLFHVFRVRTAERPNLVIVNKVLFWSSIVVPFLRLRGVRPILLTDALVGMTWWPRGLLPRIIMAIGAWTAGWLVLLSATRIVFFHPQPKGLLRFLGIAWKSQVIPTGIDESRYTSGARSPSSEVVVTYVGRLESVKGVDDFLAAVVPLLTEYSCLRVKVVGWYPVGHPIVARYHENVAFLGLRDDVPALLAGTDIFVMPSYSEGLSNALMEAMASECACIATRVGGNRFLLEEGRCGLLFPPGDRPALQHHLRALVRDSERRRALGRAARRRIETAFSRRAIEHEYARLFADALGSSA